jgi:23S rRNA (adenine2503-C2)-methyltransferase
MQIESIRLRLRELGALPVHEQRVLRDWLQFRPHEQGRRRPRDFLPKTLREALPAVDAELRGLARLVSSHSTDDGSARLLVGLGDGQTVESVLLPRDGVCVSSQVGCAVGCQFCMTGRSGLIRQVTSGEIVAQVALARSMRVVKKVVFMGMGEPT